MLDAFYQRNDGIPLVGSAGVMLIENSKLNLAIKAIHLLISIIDDKTL